MSGQFSGGRSGRTGLTAPRDAPREGGPEGQHADGEASPAIHCAGLSVGYGGDPVLEDLSFTVEAGSTLALVGRSGCGKTTLLKTLAGILDPLEGTASVLGVDSPRPPPAGELGFVPQDLGLLPHATVLRNVLHGTLPEVGLARSLLGRFPPSAEREARTAVESVGLAGEAESRVAALSGGQRRRVAVARALVQEPSVLLADEMLSELDPETASSVVDCIEATQAETGMALVVVEHDLEVATELSDARLRLGDGGIRERVDPGSARSPARGRRRPEGPSDP